MSSEEILNEKIKDKNKDIIRHRLDQIETPLFLSSSAIGTVGAISLIAQVLSNDFSLMTTTATLYGAASVGLIGTCICSKKATMECLTKKERKQKIAKLKKEKAELLEIKKSYNKQKTK